MISAPIRLVFFLFFLSYIETGSSDIHGCSCEALLNDPDCVQAAERKRREDIRDWKKGLINTFAASMMPNRPLSDDDLTQLLRGNFNVIRDFPRDFETFVRTMANADPNLEFGSTGLLLTRATGSPDEFIPHCTAILTGADVVLTARHCINSPLDFKVYFPYEGVRAASRAPESLFCDVDPPFGCNTTVDDVGFLNLEGNPRILHSIETADQTPANASEVIVEGFGYCYYLGEGDSEFCGGNSDGNHGVLRRSSVRLTDCGDCAFANHNFAEREVCFANEFSQGELDVTALQGDSGGPMYSMFGDEKQLIAVARSTASCPDGDAIIRGKYVNILHEIYDDNGWLEDYVFGQVGSDPPDPEPSWEELKKEPFAQLGLNDQKVYALQIPANADELLITLNHEAGETDDAVRFSLNLPTELDADCSVAEGIRSVEICEANAPPEGCHDLRVSRDDRFRTNRAFQMVAVCLGPGCSGGESPNRE